MATTIYGPWIGRSGKNSKFRTCMYIVPTGAGVNIRYYVEVGSGSAFGNPSTFTTSWGAKGSINEGPSETLVKTISYTVAAGASKKFSAKAGYIGGSGASYYSSCEYTYTAPKPTYTITYNHGEGGTGDEYYKTYTQGTVIKLPNNTFTKSNYQFNGWGDKTSSPDNRYRVGESYTVNSDKTFYAQWIGKAPVVTYNVKRDPNIENGVGNVVFEISVSNITTTTAPKIKIIPGMDSWEDMSTLDEGGYAFTKTLQDQSNQDTDYSITFDNDAIVPIKVNVKKIVTEAFNFNANDKTIKTAYDLFVPSITTSNLLCTDSLQPIGTTILSGEDITITKSQGGFVKMGNIAYCSFCITLSGNYATNSKFIIQTNLPKPIMAQPVICLFRCYKSGVNLEYFQAYINGDGNLVLRALNNGGGENNFYTTAFYICSLN